MISAEQNARLVVRIEIMILAVVRKRQVLRTVLRVHVGLYYRVQVYASNQSDICTPLEVY